MAQRKSIKFNRDQVVPNQCMPVQLDGLAACKICKHRDIAQGDNACSSPEIRKTGKNAAGFDVPLKVRS